MSLITDLSHRCVQGKPGRDGPGSGGGDGALERAGGLILGMVVSPWRRFTGVPYIPFRTARDVEFESIQRKRNMCFHDYILGSSIVFAIDSIHGLVD